MTAILKDPKSHIKLKEKMPLIPLKEMVVFPYMVIPLLVGRDKSIKALEEAMKDDHIVILVTQKQAEIQDPQSEDLYEYGTAATVVQVLKLPDGTAKALVEGLVRVKVVRYFQDEPFIQVGVEELSEAKERRREKNTELEAFTRNLMNQFERCVRLGKPVPPEVLVAAFNIDSPGRLADFITFHLNLKSEERQSILEAIDPAERIQKVSTFLAKELEILEIGSRIQSRVRDQMDKTQREYFLREQLKAIQKELGGLSEGEAEVEELKTKILEAKMPSEVEQKALKELDRLEKMPSVAAEAPVIRTYLDWLIGLPWNIKTEEKLNIKEAEKVLNEDHYGLNQVKERVLEYLAVRQLAEKMRGPILCFVGPPGTGKTSIGKSIARSLGRKFIRLSLGGIRDEAEIRGHRRTYVGALPGRIIQSIHQIKSKNPVFMLDEIDKVGADFRGDPSAALLEALDPEQNYAFSDHYLEVPFDLSDVMFIATANILDTIPPALRDRMEVIHFPGYTEEEKAKIAEQFLIPKQLRENGLGEQRLVIEDNALKKIIREHTREAGVRNLERNIATICRKAAKSIVEGEKELAAVSDKNLHEYLGAPKFHYGTAEEKDEAGVAVGLAWTEVGGDILTIEATVMKGKGNLTLTGQLGDVMRESAQAALSYIRTRAKEMKIDESFYENRDIHIHVPAGAIPKDGPSAGITMAAALASALTHRPTRKDVGMTGEITLRGKVLPIGGTKEKILAAHRAGLKIILLPRDNEKDLEEIPDNVKKDLQFVFVEHMDQVLDVALKKEQVEERKEQPLRVG
ncbi:MAG: endopeptidase La [Actinobacteria bacterium]|nr:endopeptidase La [Actinomycetota bacterium]